MRSARGLACTQNSEYNLLVVAVDTDELIPLTEASRMGLSALVRDAEAGKRRVLVRNNKPVAAILSMGMLEELADLEDDLLDIALATARMMTSDGTSYSLDDVLDRFGVTREELAAEEG